MDTADDGLKKELDSTLELLRTYMLLCEEQSNAIETMAKLIRKQAAKIREMQEVHGFVDM